MKLFENSKGMSY